MKSIQILKTTILFLILGFLFSTESKAQAKTEVLVIGTIHGGHQNNPNYSYQDLINILHTYNPDVICVEIRPSDFKKNPYLKEMMLATIYGADNDQKVYPIDWWNAQIDTRAERQKFIQTEDYKRKKSNEEKLLNSSKIIQKFSKKYGSLDSIRAKNKVSYEFINGKDYNNYNRENYKILLSAYGDGCMNLYSEKRNAEMMNLIDNAIAENQGKKIIILTGAEHKYYFDDALAKRKEIRVINLNKLLPLKHSELTENTQLFLEENLAKGYYDISESSSIDMMYSAALTPLIHGMGMDIEPSIIPKENIEKSSFLISEWEKLNPKSFMLNYEKSWLAFLEKDYSKSIAIMENIVDKLNDIPQDNQSFIKIFYWRNLGFCYDMTNKREKAIAAYQMCKQVCKAYNVNEDYAKKYIYKNFEQEPYRGDN